MMFTRFAGLALLAAGFTLPHAAFAQSVQLLGDYNAWSAYTTSQGAGKLCFALSKPQDVRPQPDGYSASFLYLTHRPAEGVENELNFVAGYQMAPEQMATLTIGGSSYNLFVEGDAAWLEDPSQSENLAGAMRAGATLVIETQTQNGETVTQTFSLSGATAASRAIDGAC